MEIRLNKLTLENFKGVSNFTLEVSGKNALIQGENGAGKTTCMDGFLWLMFNKDSQGKADFAIKTLDQDGQEIHNLEHAVEAILDIDGESLTLKKVLAEKWTKKRGTPKPSFSGHTTEYFLNGIPSQKKEWDAFIQDLINEDTFKLLTSPSYFNSLHWQKRRSILLQVCGDISDADVIASSHELAALPETLGNRSLEDHRKVIDAKKKEINKRLQEIPARIDELNKNVNSEVGTFDILAINARIAVLGIQIQAANDNTALTALRQEQAELNLKITEAETARQKAIREVENATQKDITRLEGELRQAQRSLADAMSEINSLSDTVERNEKEMARLREEFKTVSSLTFTGPSACPTCGQSIPADQIQDAIAKHNERKALELADINAQGKKLKEANVANIADKAKLELKKINLSTDIGIIEKNIKKIEETKDLSISRMKADNEKTIEGIDKAISAIATRLNDHAPVDTSALEGELKAEQGKIAALDHAKKTKERIAILGDEEKILAAEYEKLEGQIFLLEQFIVAKVGMLERKINSKFDLARFKLFETQINGGITETCVTIFEGVPYGAGLNTGMEINIGLDIIKTLSEHYKIKAPVWIDHAESVTHILDPGSQTIKLAVLEGCIQLEVTLQ